MAINERWQEYLLAWIITLGTEPQVSEDGERLAEIFDKQVMPWDEWEDEYSMMRDDGLFKEEITSTKHSNITTVQITELGIAYAKGDMQTIWRKT